jgi:catechol 2,3-dioxygenase-like lactoylglutathione lyase family enzyme
MIKGVHTMFYSSDAAGLRTFLRDKLGLKSTDAGDGWLIFELPEADMGCHPSDEEHGATSGTADLSFYCDDIDETVKELKAKGVKFEGEVEDHGYGLVTHFHVPGDFTIQLYQPKYDK